MWASPSQASPDFSSLKPIYEKCFTQDTYDSTCLKANQESLENLAGELSLFDEAEYRQWNREERMSFWLNSYMTWLSYILMTLPEDQSSLQKPLKPLREYRLALFGEPLSLYQMRNRIWSQFRDERCFLLLPDGTLSGPPFSRDIFTPQTVEKALLEGVLRFIRDPQNVLFRKKQLWLSPLFKEKQAAFLLNYGDGAGVESRRYSNEEMALLNFLFRSSETTEMQSAIEARNFKIYYFPVNLTLRKSSSTP